MCEATAQSPDLSEACGTTAIDFGGLNHPKSMTMISSGVTGATTSVISSTSATNSPYSTSKSSSGATSTVTGTTHVAFSESVGGDAANSVAPHGESGERYKRNAILWQILMHAIISSFDINNRNDAISFWNKEMISLNWQYGYLIT